MVRGKKLTWGKHFTMPWGKYEGQSIRKVAKEDPQYLSWLYGQCPNKFNLDAEIALFILDKSVEIKNYEGRRAKFRAAVMQLFCETLANWGELFDPTVEVFIDTVRAKFEALKCDEFIEWLNTDNQGNLVRNLAIEALWKVEDTQILSSGKSPESISVRINEIVRRNAAIIWREQQSKNYYEEAGVAFGDW